MANSNGTSAGSPLSTRTSSPPETAAPSAGQQTQTSTASGQSPMAALMSVADNLPPGSPRSAGGSPPSNTVPRSASRGSQHSPNSSGNYLFLYLKEFKTFFGARYKGLQQFFTILKIFSFE